MRCLHRFLLIPALVFALALASCVYGPAYPAYTYPHYTYYGYYGPSVAVGGVFVGGGWWGGRGCCWGGGWWHGGDNDWHGGGWHGGGWH